MDRAGKFESGGKLLITALNGRAEVYSLVGRYKEALKDYKKIVGFTGEPDKKVESFIGLGKLHQRKGNTYKANFYYKRGLLIANKYRLKLKKAVILNGLSDVKIYESKNRDALGYARRALFLFKNISEKGCEVKRGIAESLNSMAGVYSLQGELKKALEFYKKSLKVRSSIDDKEGMAVNLNNIGTTYTDLREYKNALLYLKKSLRMREEIGYVQGIALSLNNIGIVFWNQERYKEGVSYFKESLKIQRRLGDKSGVATSLNNIGIVYKTYGRYEESFSCHKESFKIRKEIGDRFGMTINLNQMGWLHFQMGEKKRALLMSKEEGKICRKIKNEPRLMNYYSLRGNILKDNHEFRKAYSLIEKSLKISRKYSFKTDEARNLYDLARVIVLAYEEKKGFSFTLTQAKEYLIKSRDIFRNEKDKLANAGYWRVLHNCI
ncbi:MAG: tetratricopeptide repeat protein [Candidatus Cloacimonadota bacterium]|nr:MAG: tetratricopeptide repeat protein [Candidatus Cloacimonadota bacterium]